MLMLICWRWRRLPMLLVFWAPHVTFIRSVLHPTGWLVQTQETSDGKLINVLDILIVEHIFPNGMWSSKFGLHLRSPTLFIHFTDTLTKLLTSTAFYQVTNLHWMLLFLFRQIFSRFTVQINLTSISTKSWKFCTFAKIFVCCKF